MKESPMPMRNESTLYKLADQDDIIYLVHDPKSNTWSAGPVAYAFDSQSQACAGELDELVSALGIPVVTVDVTELLDEHFRGREREAEQVALLEIAHKEGLQVFRRLAEGGTR